jgi:hypothetical protein
VLSLRLLVAPWFQLLLSSPARRADQLCSWDAGTRPRYCYGLIKLGDATGAGETPGRCAWFRRRAEPRCLVNRGRLSSWAFKRSVTRRRALAPAGLRKGRRVWPRRSRMALKVSAYSAKTSATHRRATRSSHALMALWASREADSTVVSPRVVSRGGEGSEADLSDLSKGDCAIAAVVTARRSAAHRTPMVDVKRSARFKSLPSRSVFGSAKHPAIFTGTADANNGRDL